MLPSLPQAKWQQSRTKGLTLDRPLVRFWIDVSEFGFFTEYVAVSPNCSTIGIVPFMHTRIKSRNNGIAVVILAISINLF